MNTILGLILLLGTAQIPAPDQAQGRSVALHAELRDILTEERAALSGIAERLAAQGKKAESERVRAGIKQAAPSGPTRFRPLAEIVATTPTGGLANLPLSEDPPLPAEAATVRRSSSNRLFELAGRAAAPGIHRFALADQALREALDRDPNHAEARRLLGFVPYKRGWATPHAVELLAKGYVAHPLYGWVLADWVPHLDRGELPGTIGTNGKPREWLPADAANALRRDWAKGWVIRTAPHFEIQTNVPLDEGVAFARRLEGLQELFFSQFADVIGAEYLPLAERFRNSSLKPGTPRKKSLVSYFADKSEYVTFFRHQFRQDESISLGYYMPLAEARRLNTKPRAYFYRDETNPIEAHATLYHEASHQLLFETVKSGIDPRRPNYWIWEGLGTYFETMNLESHGSMTVGGKVGPRFAQAKLLADSPGRLLPIEAFSALDKDEFGSLRGDAVYRHYAQAMALTIYLLNGEGGLYREAFLDFVADAYRGRARSVSLAERLGVTFETLDQGFLKFLRD